MRRFVAILLIALLPLQAAWALVGTVAAPLLPRITANPEQHDHHSDEACAGPAKSADHGQCQELDDHCTSCHGGCCAPIGPAPLPTIAQPGDAIILDTASGKPSRIHARPERPKWTGLA
ncbi:MAG: hypothetical protein AW12_01466 [Candidatus Accumulibacter sp. BA-94]|nr:MAG: hypothetical protein AW12_01466 [Candidatus Accumulibacter sp. BA-94]